ncbi:MAG: hypothetical protein L0Y73_05315 [Candidatus Aminicenantes bacterium]|nr:hypothetical protein [Candidatus Aminicenantes bacterium]
MKEALKKYLKQKIVIDTRSSLVYLGVLENILDGALELSDVDVHENKDTTSTKEVYVMESSRSGSIPNRDRVFINMDFVVSFSLLADVKCF